MAWLDTWSGIWASTWGQFAPTAVSSDSQYYNTVVEIYDDSAATTLVDVIPARYNPTCLNEIRGHGAGSFKVSKTDPRVLATPTLLDYRKFVKIRMNGIVVGAFIIQNKKTVIVGEGEEADEMWEVSGEGLRSWSRDAAVYPSKGLQANSADTRYFNFATEQGSWYKSAQWTNAVVSWTWNQSGNWYGTAPANWPDAPSAKWIWDRSGPYAMPQGYVYFRREFTAASDASYSLFIAVDDAAEVYVDGELLLTTAEHAWQDTNRIDMDLKAGAHVIGIKAYNYMSTGPGGLLAALFTFGDPLVPTSATLVLVSDTQWKVQGYPAIEPGWNMGDLLVTLITEAKNRGVRWANNVTVSFTTTTDSAGQAWADPVPWSFSVGASYEEVISAVEEMGCDIWLDPNTLTLNAYKKRGVDRSLQGTTPDSAIIFRPGLNLLSGEETGQAEIANTLILHASDGWSENAYSDTTSLTKYGRVETQMATQLTNKGAAPLIQEVFRTKALPEKSATFEILPIAGMTPFVDFNVGDTISAPTDVPGLFDARRIMSIAFAEDDATGLPQFSLEFDTIFKDRQDELEKWMSRLANSSAIGGGFTNSSTLPPTAVQGTPGAQLGSVPDAPTGLVVSSIGRFAPDGTSTSDYSLTWNAVVTGTGFGTVTVTEYEVWGRRSSETQSNLMAVVFDVFAYLQGFRSGDTWYFKIRAISRTGGPGPFSGEVSLTAANPVVALGAPSAPTLTTSMGTVTINWDGLIAGQPAPGYVRYVRVDRSGAGSGGTWVEKRRNLFNDPRGTALTNWSSGDAGVSVTLSTRTDMVGATTTAVRSTRTTSSNSVRAIELPVGTSMLASTKYRTRIRIRSSAAVTNAIVTYRPAVASSTNQVVVDTVNIPVGESYIDVEGITFGVAPSSTAGVAILTDGSNGAITGTYIDFTDVLIEKSSTTDGTMVAGDLTSTSAYRYRWLGTTNNSQSVYEINDPWVQVGTLVRGQTVDASVTTGNAYDYRLVAIDTYGGASTPSASSSITVLGVQSGDITGGLASQNLVANGSFEADLTNWTVVQMYPNGGSGATVITGGLSGSKYLQMVRGTEIPGGEIDLVVGQATSAAIPISSVGAGGYFISAKVQGLSNYTGAFSLIAFWYQGDKVTPASQPSSNAVGLFSVTTSAQYAVGQVFPPSDARFMRVGVVLNAQNATIYVDDVVAREVIQSGMIGDNSIIATHLSAGSVTANAIQAGAVNADAIAAGAITADKIAAGSITSNKLSSEVGASLDISSNSSINLIVDRQDAVEGDVAGVQGDVESLKTYYSFGPEGAIIGQTDSAFKLVLKNDQIQILENGVVVSYWDSGQMVVDRFVGNEVVLANHKFETYGTGTIVKKI